MKRYLEHIKTGHFSILRDKMLFTGLSDGEIYTFLQHSRPDYISLDPGQTMSIDKDYSHMIGVIISGDVVISSIDSDGNSTLIKSFIDGETSGTLHSILDYRNLLVEVEGKEYSEVIFINPDSLFVLEPEIASIQQKMLVNLINSQKDLFFKLSERLYCLTQRSIRDKVLKYLRFCRDSAQSDSFDISMDREELAAYLAVDRASLSRSLGELKKEKIIDFSKNHFVILDAGYINI